MKILHCVLVGLRGCVYAFCLYRKLKTSLKDIVYLESHETLSSHWKENIVIPIKNIFQEENRDIQCGVVFDPSVFIPHYLKRYLMRMEREGTPLVPGYYDMVAKVSPLLRLHHSVLLSNSR